MRDKTRSKREREIAKEEFRAAKDAYGQLLHKFTVKRRLIKHSLKERLSLPKFEKARAEKKDKEKPTHNKLHRYTTSADFSELA